MPIELVRKVVARRIADHDARKDSRARQARARRESIDDVFWRLQAEREAQDRRRDVSPLQLRRARLDFIFRTPRANDGQIRFLNGFYGSEDTQERLLAHAGKRVLFGYDPRDFSTPAMVFGWDEHKLRLLIEELPENTAADHGDADARRASTIRKRRLTKAVNLFLSKTHDPGKRKALIAQAMAFEAPEPPARPTVVRPKFDKDFRGPLAESDGVARIDEDQKRRTHLDDIAAFAFAKPEERRVSGGNR